MNHYLIHAWVIDRPDISHVFFIEGATERVAMRVARLSLADIVPDIQPWKISAEVERNLSSNETVESSTHRTGRTMTWIGFTGKARSGKDEACKILTEEFGYEQRSFAEPMRDIMTALNPILGSEFIPPIDGSAWMDGFGWHYTRWNDLQYDEAKEFNDNEGRRLLQVLGTEVGRDMFGEDFWVDLSVKDAADLCCWSDVRFLNEARAIQDREFGYIIRIERPGAGLDGDSGQHASELEIDQIVPDAVITNDGTLEDFRAMVKHEVESFMFDEVEI